MREQARTGRITVTKTVAKAKSRGGQTKTRNLPIRLGLPPVLLKGEQPAAYEKLLAQVIAAVEPKDVIEELWVRDVVDLAWEAARLRRLKAELLNSSLALGLGRILDRVLDLRHRTKLVQDWSLRDDAALTEVNMLLRQMGQSMDGVMGQTLSSKIDDIERIDRMLANAEARRNLVLREIDRHRAAVAARLRDATEQIEDASFTEVAKPDEQSPKSHE